MAETIWDALRSEKTLLDAQSVDIPGCSAEVSRQGPRDLVVVSADRPSPLGLELDVSDSRLLDVFKTSRDNSTSDSTEEDNFGRA